MIGAISVAMENKKCYGSTKESYLLHTWEIQKGFLEKLI